ncbi:MAG: hypothetical protein JKY24_07120, partial [Pseudomonadales bacterium]|nr:hypothetical protein [Pseudomonadales bacterium]
EVAPVDFVEAQGRFEAYQRNIDDRLGENIRLSQDNWHKEVKVNLDRLSVMKARLENEWPQWLEQGWTEDAEQDVNKYQLGVMNGYLGQIRLLRETAEIPIEQNQVEADVNEAIVVLKIAEHMCEVFGCIGGETVDYEWNRSKERILNFMGYSDERLDLLCESVMENFERTIFTEVFEKQA